MQVKKPKVGQILYLKKDHEDELIPIEVTKVGRKYFYASRDIEYSFYEHKYNLSNWVFSDWPYSGKVYESKQAYEDEKELFQLHKKLYQLFQRAPGDFSLDQLKRVDAILDE